VLFYENNVLYGCINPPVPGFDEVAQTEELSHGRGEPHGLRDTGGVPLPTARATVLEEIRTIPDRENMGMPPQVKWTLTEYIRSGEWERAGSASVSHAVFKYADADGWIHLHRHKCRKNQILDQFSVGELAAMVLDQTEQRNVALVKSELGKIRIAVASPLEHYLGYSWVVSFAGHFYKTWRDNTMEETPYEELAR